MKDALRAIGVWLWRWEVVSLVAFAVLAASAISAWYAERVSTAAWLAIFTVLLLTVKTITWEELRSHEQRVWQSIFVAIAALILVVILGKFTFGSRKAPMRNDAAESPTPKPSGPPEPSVQAAVTKAAPARSTHPGAAGGLKHSKPDRPTANESGPPVVGRTDNCTQSNCVTGNNYGVMSVTNNGPTPLGLSAAQAQVITRDMTQFAGRSVTIAVDGSSQDAAMAMNVLKKALEDAGLTVKTTQAMFYINAAGAEPPHGLSVEFSDDQADIATAFAMSLRNAHLIGPDEKVSAARISRSSDFRVDIGSR